MIKKITGLLLITIVIGSAISFNSENTSEIKDHWSKNSIDRFIKLDYVQADDKFILKPHKNITRAQFIDVLNKYYNLTQTSGKVYKDTKNHWSKEAVDIAITNGIISGSSKEEFKPDLPITKEQAWTLILKYIELRDENIEKLNKNKDLYKISNYRNNLEEEKEDNDNTVGVSNKKLNEYSDASDVSSWAKSSIEKLLQKGYIYGNDDKLNPKSNISTSEVIVTTNRIENGAVKSTINLNNKYSSFNDKGFKNEVYNHIKDLVNEHRAENGKKAVQENQDLAELSNKWSEYMVQKDMFGHKDLETDKKSYEVFPNYTSWNAENIAITYVEGEATSAKAKEIANKLFYMWKNTGENNKNMLNPVLNTFGFGFEAVKDTNGYWKIVATQQFKL